MEIPVLAAAVQYALYPLTSMALLGAASVVAIARMMWR
jgi:hypothetical protein